MPHDCKGSKLGAGDEILIRCRVISVFDTEDGFKDCNANLQAIDPTGEGLYTPFVTCNTRLAEKVPAAA